MNKEQIRKKIISQGINPDTIVDLLEEFISSEESDFFTQIKSNHNYSIWLDLLDWSIFEMVQLADNWTFMEQRPRICLFWKNATYYDFDEEDDDFYNNAETMSFAELDEFLHFEEDIKQFLKEDGWKLSEFINIIDDLKKIPENFANLTEAQWQVYYLREQGYDYYYIAWLRDTTESTVRDLYKKAKDKIEEQIVRSNRRITLYSTPNGARIEVDDKLMPEPYLDLSKAEDEYLRLCDEYNNTIYLMMNNFLEVKK